MACSVVVVGAFVVAGCGSSDDDSSSDDSSTTTITKADFITQANAICASSNKVIDTASEEALSSAQPSDAEIESFINDAVIPGIEGQISGIRDLGIPEGEDDQVNAILDAAQSGVDTAKDDPLAMVNEQSDPFAEANTLSTEYGLNECAG
ncbi:MAG: hypothetical protein JJE13_09765 [Thermoleophilia bacterium]|nr:hypothetical protein [Thermoleophilia bacterium]